MYESRHHESAVPEVTTQFLNLPPKNVPNFVKSLHNVDFTNILDVLRYKFYNCKTSTATRNKKGRNHEFNINIQYLVDLFVKQGGCCAHSGIPFPMNGTGEWVISVDRIDNTMGYVQGNVRLVMEEFNIQACFSAEIFANIVNGMKLMLNL